MFVKVNKCAELVNLNSAVTSGSLTLTSPYLGDVKVNERSTMVTGAFTLTKTETLMIAPGSARK
jgi:hypothetical protein